MYYVYIMTDPRTNSPFYVGKGSGNRMMVHEKMYDKPHEMKTNPIKTGMIRKIKEAGLHIIYSQVPCESEQQALDTEAELIARYGRRCNGTGTLANINPGGNLGKLPIYVHCYTMAGEYVASYDSSKIAAANYGIKHGMVNSAASPTSSIKSAGGFQWSYEKLESMSPHVHDLERSVDQYDKKGLFIQSFSKIAQGAISTSTDQGNISACCSGDLKTTGGFVWRYAGEEFSLSTHKASKRVDQYDLVTNQKIQTFESMKAAATAVECDQANIVKACQRKLKSAGGFGWSYEGEAFTYSKLRSSARQVQKLDKVTGDVLQTYDSVGIAAKENGMYTASISQCCAGKLKSAGGFLWRYSNNVGTSDRD